MSPYQATAADEHSALAKNYKSDTCTVGPNDLTIHTLRMHDADTGCQARADRGNSRLLEDTPFYRSNHRDSDEEEHQR